MKARREKGPSAPAMIRLFVAGDSPNSRLARKNLEAVLAEMPKPVPKHQVVDVFEDHKAALAARVLITSTLIINLDGHEARIMGTLQDPNLLRQALGVVGHD